MNYNAVTARIMDELKPIKFHLYMEQTMYLLQQFQIEISDTRISENFYSR